MSDVAAIYQQLGNEARAMRAEMLQEAAASFEITGTDRNRKRERDRRSINAYRERQASYPRHDPPVGILVFIQRSVREKIRINLPLDPARQYSKQQIDCEIGKAIARLAEL